MCRLLKQHSQLITGAIIVLLFSISLWQLVAASWIQGKAFVAQQLLQQSWKQTLISDNKQITNNNLRNKPWPWADTWPVAKLTVPKLNIDQIVLAGDSGSSLAFAPGLSLAGARPNTPGTTVISAHRDTHFKFLKDIKANDQIFLQTAEELASYRVYDTKIVDSKNYTIQGDMDDNRLVLVTCYPFDALTAGGSLRYLVYAEKTEL